MIHLRRIGLPTGEGRGFPFDLPALRGIEAIDLRAPVTILVGENGSGKSTLLEAVAIASRAITVGTVEAADDPTLGGVAVLGRAMRLTWTRRPARGFYLRAEDFFGFARRMDEMRTGLEAELERVELELTTASDYARGLARAPMLRELAALRERYGEGLDARSHGEAFLHLFSSRLVPGGLYLLDEPEAPLSPTRQLSLLALLKQAEADACQVLMATHSPILLAYPGADILGFDTAPLARVRYEDLEHVTVTRDFLRDPDAFLRHL